jgi:hypothetical protein
MANVFATRTGVWSATATWNTSALPTTVDDVYSNNFTIYVDNSYRVLSVRNTAAAGINAGGFFVLNNGVSLSAFAVGGGATSVYCVQALSAAPSSCTLVGNLCADNTAIVHPCVFQNNGTGTATVIGSFITPARNNGVNSSAAFIINNSSGILNLFGNYSGCSSGGVLGIINNSSGTINLVGSLSGLITGTIGNGLNNQSTGTVNITGNCFGTGDAFNGARAVSNNSTGVINIIGDVYGPGAFNQSTGTINITGNCFGRTSTNSHAVQNTSTGIITLRGNALGGTGTTAVGINNSSAGVVIINGNAIAGTGSTAYGAFNNATGFLQVQGNAIGNGFGLGSAGINTAPGIFGSQTGTTIIQGLSCGPRGQWPTAGNVFILPANTSTATLFTSASAAQVLFTSLSTNITPPASSVRLGTRYNLNDYIGTCAMPSVSSVLQGVAVDNSIGIAALQPQTVWSVQTSAIDTNSLGGRLKESATVQSFGQLLTAFNM